MKLIPYNPKLTKLAQQLRNASTLSEVLLWNQLKNNKLGIDFHRQKPLGNYIVDFYCPKLQLAIEIDGSTHDERIEKDETRQKELEHYGIHFLRFLDKDVKRNIEGVIIEIRNWIITHPLPPLDRGETHPFIPSHRGE